MSRQDYIGFLIARAHKTFRNRLTGVLRDYDLTAPQFRVLHCLFESDGLPARELVIRLSSDSSTIMTLIDRLEKKALVRRVTDQKDRRVNRIHLTDKSKTMLPQILNRVDRFEKTIQDRFGADEVRRLRESLSALYEFIKRPGDLPSN